MTATKELESQTVLLDEMDSVSLCVDTRSLFKIGEQHCQDA